MSVLELVARETRRAARAARVAGVALPMAAVLGLLTGGALWLGRGRWLAVSPVVPFVVWFAALALGVAAAVRVRARLARRASGSAVARAIEDEQRLRRGALTGLLEVAPAGGVFVDNAVHALGERLAAVSERPAPRHRRRLRRAAVLSFVALAQVLGLASTSFARRADGWRALFHPVDAWRGTLLPALTIADAPRRLPRGAAIEVGVAAPGRTQVTLRWRATGGAWRDTTLVVDADGRAAFRLAGVDADLALVASDGRAQSDTAHVRVVDRPFVGDVTVRAVYPAYLGRAAERLATDAPIRVPAGTRLELDGHSSEPLENVTLRAGDARLALRVAGTTFAGAFTPSRSADWTWEARGPGADIADLPAPLAIEVLADSVPRVEILAPVGEVLVGPEDRVTVEILAQDDHALTGVWFRRQVMGSEGEAGDAREARLSDGREREWVGAVVVDLEGLGLAPGMSVRLQATARDAAPGAREGASQVLVLRIPTREEERRAARDLGESAVAAAQAAARAQAQLAERTEAASRARADRASETRGAAPSPDRAAMGYEDAERSREIAERQRALQERVEALEDAARDMEDRLRRAGALDTALARQLQEAQRLLREAMTPEMLEALRRVDGASQELDGDRARRSLAELAQQQQRVREALERSAEMLKRAALEGAMRTLGDDAAELAERQRALADSAGRAAPDTARTRATTDRTDALGQALDALRERLRQERAQTGAEGAERAAAEAERSEAALREAMRRAQESAAAEHATPRERAAEGARDAAREAADAMQRAAEAMQRGRDGQVAAWKGELTDALDRTVQEMLQLAREQDALAEAARRDPSDASLRGQQSALQQGVQTAQQRLEDEGRKSALVSPRTQQLMEQARQRSAQASREAAQGQRSQQAQAMEEAATALRQAAAQLTRDRERAAAAQSASGLPELMEQLQQLAQQQGALNSQMQSLLPGAQARARQDQAQGLDAAGRAQARELARSQREVARKLDELTDADPTGRAQELAREARMLAQAIDQGAVDPATQARQERLFQRMLDAGRTLEQEQRDESQRRESRAARGAARFTPSGDAVRGRDAARYAVPTWEELRGLSADERRLVIEYFRRLNAEARP